LRNEDLARSFREAAAAGDGAEVAELAQFHDAMMIRQLSVIAIQISVFSVFQIETLQV
jgi:hypothetical protein